MKLVIISDIHGNYDAWSALPEEYDELWVLGDLVNYGPQPKEVFEEVTQKASLIVRGNHDHAVDFSGRLFRPSGDGAMHAFVDQIKAALTKEMGKVA